MTETRTAHLHTRIAPTLKARAAEQAKRDGMNVSKLVEMLLIEYLREKESE